MNSSLKYRKIKDFKFSGTAVFGKVNYANVVAIYLYDTSLGGWIKKIIFSLFYATRVITHETAKCRVLLFYSARHKKRADYDYIPNQLREILGRNCSYAESEERFSIVQAWQTLTRFWSSFQGVKGYRVGVLQKVATALLIAKYRTTAIYSFRSLLRGQDRLVTFCDAHAPENLLAQMGNTAGLFTVTNQHGQYRVLDERNMSSDAEAYSNFVSRRMLCWGKATQAEFSRYGFPPENLIVSGWVKDWSRLALPRAKKISKGVFGVMLNADSAKESNLELIATAKFIAQELGLQYLIRLHPWSRPKEYLEHLDGGLQSIGHFDIATYLIDVDFSLAHMSGAVVEVLYAGAPIYLLNDGRLAQAFQVDGLSYPDSCSIVAAVKADQLMPIAAQRRFLNIGQWYNDDRDQAARIRKAIFEGIE
ncbi:hypothetical protein [Variovorax paradoxus]|uniref:hypothetical protein n=1 Tax=Variovorax paradoxus TaxID=34073 RepID=UPI0012BC0A82|nr:hypothetical protein [Variovorax paradoxus]